MRSAHSPDNAIVALTLFALFTLFTLLSRAAPAAAQTAPRILIQSSPLAGFTYHEAPQLFARLSEGDALDLRREPDNPHDKNAIRVEWRGHLLGYVPRRHNAALAWTLDRGERASARVSRLREHPNPRERVEFEVFAD